MIPSYFSYQIHPLVFFSKIIALHQNAGMTQDNFILPALPAGGLPISQDWLDRMKLVRDRTIPIILPSGKNLYWLIWCLKSVLGTPTLTRGKYKADLAADSGFSLPLMSTWLGTQQKVISLLAKLKKDTFVSPSRSNVRQCTWTGIIILYH